MKDNCQTLDQVPFTVSGFGEIFHLNNPKKETCHMYKGIFGKNWHIVATLWGMSLLRALWGYCCLDFGCNGDWSQGKGFDCLFVKVMTRIRISTYIRLSLYIYIRASPAVLSTWPWANIFSDKTETGTQIGGRLLIANHLDESLWWANQRNWAAVRSYLLHSFLQVHSAAVPFTSHGNVHNYAYTKPFSWAKPP